MYIQHARYGRPSSEVSSHYFKRESTPITGHASYRESKSGDSAVMKRWNGLQFELIPRPEVVCMIVRIVISHQLIIWLKTPNRHHPHCRPSCRRHSDALLSVTAFQTHHLITVLPCPQIFCTKSFSAIHINISVCSLTAVRQCDPRVMDLIMWLNYPDDMATLMSSALLTPLLRVCVWRWDNSFDPTKDIPCPPYSFHWCRIHCTGTVFKST